MHIPHIIRHAAYIIEGYAKWLYDVVTREGSRDSLRRLAVCEHCEHRRRGICSLCGCIIKAKVRVKYMLDDDGLSVEGCPERKW